MGEGKRPFWLRFVADGGARDSAPTGYSAYTKEYDVEIDAASLDSVLGPLTGAAREGFEAAHSAFEHGLAGWRTAFDIECLTMAQRLSRMLTLEQRRDTVVSLLIDHSGSMKGQRLLMVAAMTASLAESLIALGIKVEVLGFTTVSWKGGEARAAWRRWRTKRPGRLCELLHIVYRGAGDPSSKMPYSLRQMLRPDLPKENIDGEAIEWAARRLRERGESRKVLLVLSDGAPVDDATILANNERYLPDHLKQVVAANEAAGDIAIGAVDICSHHAKNYFARVVEVDDLLSLGTVTLGLAERLIVPPPAGQPA